MGRHWRLLGGNEARAGGRCGSLGQGNLLGLAIVVPLQARLTEGLSSRQGEGVLPEGRSKGLYELWSACFIHTRERIGLQQEGLKEDLQKDFLLMIRGSGGRWEHLRREGQGLGRGGPMAKGSTRLWIPTFSSELPLQ